MSSGGLRWAIAWLSEKLAAQRRRARVFFQTPSSMSGRTLIRSYDSAGKSSSALKHRGGQQDAQKFVLQWAEKIARPFRGRLAHRPHCPNEALPEMFRPDLRLQ